jgi:O-glycosyl hydrolase
MLVIGLVTNIIILPVNTVSASLKNVSINPEVQYQEFDGWGTCLAWWAGQVGGWSEKTKKELMDLIFGKNGLELNIVRYNIGGGENPDCPYNKIGLNGEKIPHMHFGRDMEGFSKGYDQNTNQIIWKWDADKNQREILKLTKQYNVDIYEAQSNSPPYWMTYTQCVSGNGGRDNLKPEYYGLFAEYLTEVVKHIYEEDGIKFQYLDPLNEPSASWWNAGGTQEGCHFDLESQAKIIEEVYNKARAKGLDIKIVGPDESIIDTCIQTVLYYKDNNILQYVDRINTHTYGGSKRYQLRDLVRSIGKKLWMSEFSTGYIADDHQKMAPALPLAWTILHDIKDMGASAWVIWQVVENEVENYYNYSNNKLWNPPGSWGLIHAAYHDMDLGNGIRFSKEQYWITKQYYVMAQFSKFIKKGYKIIDISESDSIAAYSDKDKKLVIVTLNEGDTKKYFNYDLSKFNLSNDSVLTVYRTSDDEALCKLEEIIINNDSFSYEIKENSVTTFVISNVRYEGQIGDKINDNVTGPPYFNYSNGWSYYDQQSGAYSNDVHYSNIKDAYVTLTFKGYSIFLYGAKAPDQGIIAVSVDNNPEEFIDCYHNSRQDGVLIYKNTNLQYGNHTLKIRITGNKNDNATNTYFTLDYTIIYNMPYYNNQIKPKITNVFSYNNRVRIIFESIDGATEYIVKYGEKPDKLNNIIRGIHDNVVDIYALRNSGRYYFAISAVINGYETATSNVVGINVTDKTDNTLLYYVDCGANTLLPGDVLGSRNSVIDQEYRYDPLTGYKWGYITDNGTWNNGENDRFRRIRQNDGGREGQGITYKFEVPAGMYRITLGFNDPWGNSARKQDVLINNKLVLQDYVPPPRNDVKIFDGIYVNDNTLSISILRSKGNNGQYENPIISWIRVEKIRQEIPDPPIILSIEKGSKQITVNIRESNGADFYKIYIGKDPNSFDKIIKVPNNTLNPTITGLSYDVDYYLTATAVNKYGESLKSNVVQVKLKREVAEPNLMYYANAGDSTPNSLETYGNVKEEYGYLQSVEDQNYGKDNVTGYYWGNIEEGTGTGTWDDSNINNPLLRPIRWKKNDDGTKGINYTFELPNGIYNVENWST